MTQQESSPHGLVPCWMGRTVRHSVKARMHTLLVLTYYQWIGLGLASLLSWQRAKRRFPRLSPIRFPSLIALAMSHLSAVAWSF